MCSSVENLAILKTLEQNKTFFTFFLFSRIKVVLEGSLVEFSPKLKTLANVVNTISKDLTAALTVLPRLLDVLTPVKSKKKVEDIFVTDCTIAIIETN